MENLIGILLNINLLPLFFMSIGIGLFGLFIGPIGRFDPNAFFTIPTILLAGLYAGPLVEETRDKIPSLRSV